MTISDNRFSQRVGRAIGGNRAAGPLADFPLDITSNLDHCLWFNDFLTVEDYDSTTDQPWILDTITGVAGSPTIAITADSLDGVLLCDGGTTADEGLSTQYAGTDAAGAFLDRGDHMSFSFGARLKKDVAANGACFVGLMITDATPMLGTTGALTASDYLGFWTAEDSAALILTGVRASGTITYGDASGGTSTLGDAQSTTLASDTYVDVAFVCHTNDISVIADSGYLEAFQWVTAAAGAPTGVSRSRWVSMGRLSSAPHSDQEPA